MTWLEKLHHPEDYVKIFFKWAVLGILMGCIGGFLGGVFHHVLHFVTHLRSENTWLIFLLPLGGLATVGLYRAFHMQGNKGTNEIIDSILEDKPVNPMVAPAIFLSTTMTHFLGGSAGREGAALQLGGSVGSWLAKALKLSANERTVLIMSGMSAVFAGLFGTPLTACIFVLEFVCVGRIFTPALVPCYLSAFVASLGAEVLGVHPETYALTTVLEFTLHTTWKYFLLAILIALLGITMCYVFHKAEHLAAHYLPNTYIRIAVGGVIVVGLTLLVGDHRYNGAGMDMALEAVAGHADWYAFVLKMLFTVVTLSAGFKGGEIVPTFCIGATFGCVLGGLLGVDPGVSAALGLIGLFCCVTNSPLASIVLSMEMFGSTNLYLFALVCVICFVLSGHSGLYASQVIEFNKASVEKEGRA